MSLDSSQTSGSSSPRRLALARWDNEGGARDYGPRAPPARTAPVEVELLHARIIALENLLIALLEDASDPQLRRIRERATFIAPRPSVTQHRLTVGAAHLMVDLVIRAMHFRHANESSAGALPVRSLP